MPSESPAAPSAERIVLTDPAYVERLLDGGPRGPTDRKMLEAIKPLLDVFDRKPYAETCFCGKQACLATLYEGNTGHMYMWCAWEHLVEREPLASRKVTQLWVRPAGRGHDHISAYRAAIEHARHDSRFGNLGDRALAQIIRNLARAKGLGARITAHAARAFFETP